MSEFHFISANTDQNESKLELLLHQVKETKTVEELIDTIDYFEHRLKLNQRNDTHAPLTIGFNIFFKPQELDPNGMPMQIDMSTISIIYKRNAKFISEMFHHCNVTLGKLDHDCVDINGVEMKVGERINRLLVSYKYAYDQVATYTRQYEMINCPTLLPVDSDSISSLFECSTIDTELKDISPYQRLLFALYDETYKRNYRKYKGQCCEQVRTVENFYTKAWKPIMTIPEFVYSVAQKETRFDMWLNMTSRSNNAREAIKHLTDSKDIQFPEIKKKRHVWSFKNGIFFGKWLDPEKGVYTSKFFSYTSDEYKSLHDPTIVSAKYFDKQFDDFTHIENWYDIPTPNFQSVMDYQKFDEDVCKWMYVMGGRLCFEVGDMDGWQVIPFLKGIARSGKSTLITKVFKKFYESEDVRTLSNNIERKFGLSGICDGFMFIAPEVKGDLCLEQAEFQSLVSGEDVSVAQKYEKPKSVEWKTPGILGGNEIPNWKDNSGSVLRRLLTWNFGKQVKDADPKLDDKLDAEIPIILLKCVRAYLDYSQKYSGVDIWNCVPKYFKLIQTQVAMVTNTLQNFLASEKVKYGQDMFVPQKIFIQIFNQHCQENNLGKVKFNPDFYAGPFSSRDLEVRTEAVTYKGRVYASQPVVYGIDVVEETLEFTDDY